jgi:type II secretory pathway pseudopilin PulG
MSSTRRGLTLVEMLVVIGLVVFLTGLSFTVGTAALEHAQRRQTQRALQLLDLAVQEWELAADRSLRWWDSHDDRSSWPRAEVHADTAEVLIITEMLGTLVRNDSARRIVRQIDPDQVHAYEPGVYPVWIARPEERQQQDERFAGDLTVLDAWGTPIYATHPGRLWRPTDAQGPHPRARDEDGTIRTYNEMRYGVAANRTVNFVSAGPDRQFGWHYLPEDTDGYRATADNMAAHPIESD